MKNSREFSDAGDYTTEKFQRQKQNRQNRYHPQCGLYIRYLTAKDFYKCKTDAAKPTGAATRLLVLPLENPRVIGAFLEGLEFFLEFFEFCCILRIVS